MTAVPHFRDDECRKLLTDNYDELFKRLKRGLVEFSSRNKDTIIQPVRLTMDIPNHSGNIDPGTVFLLMPAFSATDRAFTTKLLSVFPANRNVPVVNATVTLFDVDNGQLKAIMDGNAITEIRTAMASAVAAKQLVPLDRVHKLAIVGCGVQARGHIHVFKHFFNFDEISVWSRDFAKAESFGREHNARACETVKDAIDNADIIITVTNSQVPLLKHEWVKTNAFICSIGACRPDMRELQDDLMMSSTIYTDSREAALQEAGDIIQSGAQIYAEIGDVITGKAEIKSGISVFKSLGMAVEDTIAAQIIYERRGQLR